ncbi:hypothetical protein HU200_038403 [Digitaria exilis]|uniref:Uncharacterized protein n=1 Tax=Digitaria exilis TaxID=1010633 RepID=A0A835BP26_9POAL|nr:hypothetical protein HU200_038403 [Digitaria exilis]
MARMMLYLMATSLMVLVMISSNSPSCEACLGPFFGPPCFHPPDNYCTDETCSPVCKENGYRTNRAYCQKPKKGRNSWFCCCPQPR